MKQKTMKHAILGFCFLLSGFLFAQKSVNGTVTDQEGVPLPGATIVVIETNDGATTDFDGNYSISAADGLTLEISFVGYESQQVVVGADAVYNVSLVEGNALDEIVVTALGIKRAEKTLTYASQTVKSEDLTQARDISFANSLNGRAAGVEIRKSASGAGGSTRIILRGNKSLSGDSQPLIVIDGVPIVNNRGSQPGTWGGIDSGDGLSQINPDDIESINILKGANASILYGSQGANGVILITTKSGEEGDAKVTINSGVTFESVIKLPELQYNYGASGGQNSWDATPGNYDSSFVDDFFQTGANYVNSVSISGGGKKTKAYFSYYNSTSTGIMENFKYQKNNVSFKQSTKFLNDKMTISSNILLTDEKTDNRAPAGYYLNPLTALYMHPRERDFSDFKNYETFNAATNMMDQNFPFNYHFLSNPYWIMNKQPKEDKIRRAISSLNLNYEISDKLSFQARASYDFSNKSYEQQHAAGSNPTNTGSNGRWDYKQFTDELFYTDAIFTYNNDFSDDLTFNAVLGASLQKTTFGNGVNVSTGGDGVLFYANEFNFQNLPTNIQVQSTLSSRIEKQALFANFVFGYKDAIFLDVAGRNDYASTLALTGNESYFYPSYGISAIISELVTLPEVISFAKVRVSSASVGNEVPFNKINPANTVTAAGGVNRNTQKPFTDLKPEMIETTEFGLDLRLLNNRIGIDLAVYDIKSTDQYLQLSAPAGSGYTTYFVNAGEITNNGIELSLRGNIIEKDNLSWTSIVNITQNKNKIVSIHPDIANLSTGSGEGFGSRMVAGGSIGDFYVSAFDRDSQGRIIVDATGQPQKVNDTGADVNFAGNAEPEVSVGWSNNFTFGDKFSAGFIINGKFGGKVFSKTEMMLNGSGTSLRSGQARDNGGVSINGVDLNGNAVSSVPAAVWYSNNGIGDRNGISEPYVYDRTNIRLTQLSLAYNIDTASLGIPVEAATLSLIGNNLLYSAEAPFDPELAMSTNRNSQGIDNFNLPSTRTIGMNLRLTF
jgi:TonB-linked SusC/RagA family outer membrane protein